LALRAVPPGGSEPSFGRPGGGLARPIAILRFSPTEGPGYFSDWLDAQGLPWQLAALDEGAAVPADPRAFAGIGLMGGPMSVNDGLAWTEPVCALLRAAVDAEIPVLGHCLGGQLLAQALGAPVTRAPVAEIGWLPVDVCDVPAQHEWFGGRSAFTTFQWHYDAFALPAGATAVLTNAFNVNQAYVVGGRHIGFQCHIEMTRPLVETWLATGAQELPAQSSPAAQSAADIRRDLDARVNALHAVADDIYARWARGLMR
jgi:GMP synthase-like glutamine amidotransferase